MPNQVKELYEFDKFRLDVDERLLTRNGERVPVSEKAFDTLCVLVRRANHLVRKDELLEEVWTDAIVEENNLDKNISLLRQVLGERHGKGKFIETVRGHGFRFVAEVRNIRDDETAKEQATYEHASAGSSPVGLRTRELSTDSSDLTTSQIPALVSPTGREKKKRQGNLPDLRISIVAVCLILAILTVIYFRRQASTNHPTESVAVLPFKSLVSDQRDAVLELGMADALISKLSDGANITVRPLSAIRRYDSPDQDSLNAGRELGVEVVLDGSLQRTADRIRVSARLLRVADGKQLWAANFDEKFTDIFAVQDSISSRVATALKTSLNNKQKRPYTDNVEAYQLYMKGRYHALRLTRAETDKAITHFQQALQIDPNYALAYVGLGRAYLPMALTTGVPSREVVPKAKAAAARAVEIDPNNAEGHVVLGFVSFWYEWDWQAAEAHYMRALDLDPKSAEAHFAYAHLLSNKGRHDKAIQEIKRSRELDPLALATHALEGQIFFFAHRYDEAIDSLLKTIDLEPNFWLSHLFISRVYTEKGMYAEAVAEAKRAGELSGNSQSQAYRAYALAKGGNLSEARKILDELLELTTQTYVPPYNVALAYNAVGQKDKALDYLKKAFDERDVRMVFLTVEPQWNNLRTESQFVDLLKRMKVD